MISNPHKLAKLTPHSPQLVDARTAAKMLSICERTLFTVTKSGQLRSVRIGRSVRYDIADIEIFIESQKG